MKYFNFIFILIFCQNTLFSQDIDSLTAVLESEMEKRDYYDSQKIEYIRQLEKKASNVSDLSEKYTINDEIFEAYQYYSFDRALYYLEKNIVLAKEIDDKQLLNKAKLSLGLLLVNTGRYKESIDVLNSIETDSLQQSLVNDYYIAYKEGYSGISLLHNRHYLVKAFLLNFILNIKYCSIY